MGRRSILLIVAVLIALLGTSLIVLYVKGIDQRATEGQEMVPVLIASATIKAGEDVAAAQEAGKFEKTQVRRADLITGALTSTSDISDSVALATIYPGEQILKAKFGSLSETQSLVITDNKMAVSVELTDFERVAGFVNPGSEIAVFATAPSPVRLDFLGKETKLGPVTRLVLARTLVLGVGTTSVTSKKTTTDEGEESIEAVAQTILTLAVTQEEAEKLIHADRLTDLTFALLTKDSKSTDGPGATLFDIFPETFALNPTASPTANPTAP